jgi:uncharacterized protein YciI
MPVFAVHYVYDQRFDERDEVRPTHRAYLQSLADQGVVLARGPYVDADDPGALIVVRAETADDAAEFMDADPFWRHGFIAERRIREWTQIGGPFQD